MNIDITGYFPRLPAGIKLAPRGDLRVLSISRALSWRPSAVRSDRGYATRQWSCGLCSADRSASLRPQCAHCVFVLSKLATHGHAVGAVGRREAWMDSARLYLCQHCP